jgi:TPR repeat protein
MPLFHSRQRRGPHEGQDVEDLQHQVNDLRAALAASRIVIAREKHWLVAAICALILLVLYVILLNIDPLKHTVESLTPSQSEQPVLPLDAANAAYRGRDDATALRLARPLAEQGDPRAQTLLGLIYHRGRAVPLDEAQATEWFQRAAEQGEADAQIQLGMRYSEGRGVPQNFAEAAKWYRLAADQGKAQAQYFLGLLYSRGEGVPLSNVNAHMWFNLAAAHFPASDPLDRQAAAKNRDAVAFKMSREEISRAQQLAREWKMSSRPQNGS